MTFIFIWKLLYVTDTCKSMTVTYNLFWFLWFLNAMVIIFFMKFCKLFIKFSMNLMLPNNKLLEDYKLMCA